MPPAVAQAVKANCLARWSTRWTSRKKPASLIRFRIQGRPGRDRGGGGRDGHGHRHDRCPEGYPEARRGRDPEGGRWGEIEQLEKSEVRAEIKTDGGKGAIVKLAAPKYVFEAELIQGKERGEVQVAPDGKIVEGPKWGVEDEKAEEMGEKEKPGRERSFLRRSSTPSRRPIPRP